jgi:hypothetical protein
MVPARMQAIVLRRPCGGNSRRGLVARGAALAVVAGAAAAGALGPPPAGAARTAVPPCSASQLAALYVNTTAAAGSRDAEYGFRNLGRPCTLLGYPSVVMLTGSGAVLSTTERHTPGAYGIAVRRVPVGHNAVAYFGVHFAAQTGYDRLRCPTSAALRLTAPGTAAGVVLRGRGGAIQPFGGTIPHLHCGILDVSPLGARPFQ